MNTKLLTKTFSKVSILALVAAFLMPTANAQNLNEIVTSAGQAEKDGEIEKAQALYARIMERFDEQAPPLYGPRFGFLWYKKGMTELKLASKAKRANNADDIAKWFDEAVKSFSTCYTKYRPGAPNMAASPNLAHKVSLLRWGEALQGKQEYDEAIKKYKKYLAEKEEKDKLLPTPGVFYVNLAICHFLMEEPKIEEGTRHFETALKNKEKWKTSETSIIAGFLAFSKAVIKKKNEAALVDFLRKNRADITLEPFQMYEYTPVFLKLAANALEVKMNKAAYNLYAMIPNTEEVIADINVRIETLGGRRGIRDGMTDVYLERLELGLERMRKKLTSGDPDEVTAIRAVSYLNAISGNTRGVFAAMEQLELYYNKSKHREKNLFSLVRASAVIDEILLTEKYGSRFLNDFPESEHVEDVRNLMLTSLFFGGEYAKSLEVSAILLEKVEQPSQAHDIALFVNGGSNFYLGNYDEAQPLLEKHIKEYPESKFNKNAEYFQASNNVRLQYWEIAAKQLDAFLEKYNKPAENSYYASALYDRADCHFAESQYEEALVLLSRIENEFASNPVAEQAYSLKGKILEATGDLENAEKYYLLALNTAESRGNDFVAGEALKLVAGMLADAKNLKKLGEGRIKDAVPYYDKFLEKYSDSPFKAEMLIFGMPAMRAVNREDEGLENLKNMISEIANREQQYFLEETVDAFSEAFLLKKGNTPQKLKDLYYQFPGIDFANKKTLALLRIAIIGVFEDQLKRAKEDENGDLTMKYEADINALFKDLKAQFEPKDLTNFVLIRIGNYLRTKTSAPKQSLPYYEELLAREDKGSFEFDAILGVADVLGQSDADADMRKAVAQLEDLIKRVAEDPEIQEDAYWRLVQTSARLTEWADVEKYCKAYLNGKFAKKAAEVSFFYAQSFDKRNMKEDALFNYGQVYSRYTGFIRISAPSVKRVMELMWDRNLPEGAKVKDQTLKFSDRQTAYSQIGYNYIRSTKGIREGDKITDEEKVLWDEVDDLVKKYENSGQVLSWEKMEEIRLENLRRGRADRQ